MNGDVFRGLRMQIGVSQTVLARMLDVHPVTVNKWERGGRTIPRVVELAMWGIILMEKNRDANRPPATGAESDVRED